MFPNDFMSGLIVGVALAYSFPFAIGFAVGVFSKRILRLLASFVTGH